MKRSILALVVLKVVGVSGLVYIDEKYANFPRKIPNCQPTAGNLVLGKFTYFSRLRRAFGLLTKSF